MEKSNIIIGLLSLLVVVLVAFNIFYYVQFTPQGELQPVLPTPTEVTQEVARQTGVDAESIIPGLGTSAEPIPFVMVRGFYVSATADTITVDPEDNPGQLRTFSHSSSTAYIMGGDPEFETFEGADRERLDALSFIAGEDILIVYDHTIDPTMAVQIYKPVEMEEE